MPSTTTQDISSSELVHLLVDDETTAKLSDAAGRLLETACAMTMVADDE